MDTDCKIFLALVLFLCIVWLFLETHYFLQIFSTMFISRFIKKKIGIFDETSYYGICSTTDVDIFFDHMNNNRYLRDLDFARTDFYIRSQLMTKIMRSGGHVLVGANLAIYKRPIRPLTAYNITSKITYWEKKSIFMEHRFVTASDGVLRATILSQQRLINCDADVILQKLHGSETPITKPPMPPEVDRLLQTIKASWTNNENTSTVDVTSLKDVNANGKVVSQKDTDVDVPKDDAVKVTEVESES